VQSSSNPQTCKSSSSFQRKQDKNIKRGESNEGRVGGDDGYDPLHVNLNGHIQCPNKNEKQAQVKLIPIIQ
jgi:hypothetical protein